MRWRSAVAGMMAAAITIALFARATFAADTPATPAPAPVKPPSPAPAPQTPPPGSTTPATPPPGNGSNPAAPGASNPTKETASPTTKPAAKPRVRVTTELGDIIFELWPDVAPNHVEQIKWLVGKQYYDGVVFHRVVRGFIVQGGDPTGTGTGGPGFSIRAEFSDKPHERGTLSMARRGDDVDSAGSQFFICLDRETCKALDGKYTVFGRVVRGMDVVDQIVAGKISRGDRPDNPVKIVRARMMVEEEPEDPKLAAIAAAKAAGNNGNVAKAPTTQPDDTDKMLDIFKKAVDDVGKAPVVDTSKTGEPGVAAGEKVKEMSALAEENKKAADAFLTKNKDADGVRTTASGLQYMVLKPAAGATPGKRSTVTVHYRGTLLDGTEFDSSYKKGKPISFPVDGVIAGWQEGLQLMNVGGKYRLFIPSYLAYGPRGMPPRIGPNAALIFEIELIESK